MEFEDARGAGNLNPSKVPADLLEEVFELNMQLEELRQNQKMGEDDPQLRRDLEAAKNHFTAAARRARRAGALPMVGLGCRLGTERRSQENRVQRSDDRACCRRRSYLQNLVRDVDETLGGS